ncbi:hybrid sensor histidine kinase/response regulator, partial [Thermodesulfobacteriota bacterium]
MKLTGVQLQVCIVDDEVAICKAVKRLLEEDRLVVEDVRQEITYAVTTFVTAEAFLAHLRSGAAPDILLLDIKLPGIDGIELLEKHIYGRRDIITVMVSAYASLETAVKATKLGGFDFLAKPFTPDELCYTVGKAATHAVLTAQARRLEEEKRQIRFQFISILAHELKSPLNAVQGYLDIIQNRAAGEQLEDYDAIVGRSRVRLDGMRKLVEDLLDLTKIESGRKQRHIEPVDVVAAARGTIENNMPDAEQRGIAIELQAPPEACLQADAGEIDVILNNLVSNAVKYNRESGGVSVTITADAGRVSIAVADTGIGLTEDETRRLFQEFVRIKNDDTKKILGSGLGLSIVKKLARLYAGDVTVTSKRRVGTTFTVELASDAPHPDGPAPVPA